MASFQSIDPTSGRVLAEYDATSEDEVNRRLSIASVAQHAWSHTRFAQRAQALRELASTLRGRRSGWAALMTAEMGKPIGEASGEIEKCAWVCDYYAEHGAELLSDREVRTDASRSLVSFRPLGLVLAIMPWNFPFWQFFRCAAPALMAGNGLILKHAANVSGCALAIEEACNAVAPLRNLVGTVLVDAEQASALIGRSEIAAVTLTGSTRAGAQVAAECGRHLKKCVLELGGSDPYVVLGDANIERATDTCLAARMINGGQSCIAAKRLIVVKQHYAKFCEQISKSMAATVMGDPNDPATRLGPMARLDLRDEMHQQVQRSVSAGASLATGGYIPDRPGSFYPPTVLINVRPGMAAFDEELFGPVAAIIRADDDEDAIRLANQSDFGLGGAIFSENLERATALARDVLEVGSAFVNAQVRSDPRLPFGGIKHSGFGRELGSFGILEFVNVKTVYVA